MLCEWNSAAAKRYQWTVAIEMAAYLLIVFGVSSFVHRHTPAGMELYLLSALPSIPIVGVLSAVGVYLRDEKDEYQRDVMVKCILWGTAGVLVLTTFLGFLHSFGWAGSAPPFLEFVTFWLLVGLAKLFHRLTDRPAAED